MYVCLYVCMFVCTDTYRMVTNFEYLAENLPLLDLTNLKVRDLLSVAANIGWI